MSPMELQEPLEKLLFNTNTDDEEGETVSNCDLEILIGVQFMQIIRGYLHITADIYHHTLQH